MNGHRMTWVAVMRPMAPLVVVSAMLGCSTLELDVDSPALPTIPTAQNDLLRADYVGMTQTKDGKGMLAVRLTNLSGQALEVGGNQGALLPTMGDNKAWLVFRGHADVARFAKTELKVELTGTGEANVDIDVPDEGTFELAPGKSKTVLVGFELASGAKELAVDLQPLVVTDSVHDEAGRLRTLYLTAPVVTVAGLKSRAKEVLESTKIGFRLTSDDI